MNLRSMLSATFRYVSLPSDNPELLQAQCTALSRLIPLLYVILIVNSWILAATFFDRAPAWLTVDAALALTVVCAERLVIWWRKRDEAMTGARAARELRRTTRLAALLSIAFCVWGFALFPYGDDLAQGHVAFFLTISALSTMFCLIHVRTAALTVAVTVGTACIAFFVSTGRPSFVGMALNVTLIMAASLVVILIQSRDFTRMVMAQIEARRRNEEQSRLLRMIDDMPIAVMTVDCETFRITYANETSVALFRSLEHLLPIEADRLVGTCIDLFHDRPEHQRQLLADPKNLPFSTRIALGPEMLELKVSAVHAYDGSYVGPMISWALVTKEVESENHIRQLAHYDTLTSLPNRTTFHASLDTVLAQPGARVGLLYVDLDGFKMVNDTRGHRVGDILLRRVAERLRMVCAEHPGLTIGRLGGDEFAMLVPDGHTESAEAVAARIVEAIGQPFRLDGDRQVQIGASVGIALAPFHGTDGDTLVARADMALYAAKEAGRRTYKVFELGMETRLTDRVVLEAQLRTALQQGDGLFVFYQPIFDIESRALTAREALVRWHHPERGWISPGEFVPIAEQGGTIEQLGAFVLRSACQEAAGWTDGAQVAVNVSAGQLGRGTLVPTVLDALRASGLPHDRLEVEITETALLNDEADSIAELQRLRDLGVRVALDDFGTGYSSLAHLRAFPFDKIKIDGSFVRDAVERPDCAAVVNAIADLGKRLGVTTVAEGVETEAHLERVRAEGCDEVQGYLFGRPLPSDRDRPMVERLNRSSRESVVLAKAG